MATATMTNPNYGLSKRTPLVLPLLQGCSGYDRVINDGNDNLVATIETGGGDCHTNDVAGQILRAVNSHDTLVSTLEQIRSGIDRCCTGRRLDIDGTGRACCCCFNCTTAARIDRVLKFVRGDLK
jgi:hypothetical protein